MIPIGKFHIDLSQYFQHSIIILECTSTKRKFLSIFYYDSDFVFAEIYFAGNKVFSIRKDVCS